MSRGNKPRDIFFVSFCVGYVNYSKDLLEQVSFTRRFFSFQSHIGNYLSGSVFLIWEWEVNITLNFIVWSAVSLKWISVIYDTFPIYTDKQKEPRFLEALSRLYCEIANIWSLFRTPRFASSYFRILLALLRQHPRVLWTSWVRLPEIFAEQLIGLEGVLDIRAVSFQHNS